MNPTRAFALIAALLVATPLAARAQQPPPPPGYVPVPPPSDARTYNGEYVAPLQQQTQPSYVPQSVALSGPRIISTWNEGDAIPAGYHPETQVRKGLIGGGAGLFGGLYFVSAIVAAAGSDSSRYCDASYDSGCGGNPEAAMWIPVLGPFIQMAKSDSATANVFLFVDGAGQAAGVAMMIAGIWSPRHVLVRNDLATIQLAPVATAGYQGAMLYGSF